MRLIVQGRRTEVTPSLKTYIEEKLFKSTQKILGNADDDLPLLEIEFSRVTRHHLKGHVWRVEANLQIGKRVIRAEAQGEDPHEVVDLLQEDLIREIKSFKDKDKTKKIRGARTIKRMIKKSPA